MRRARALKGLYWGLVIAAFGTMIAGYSIRGEVWYDALYYALQAFCLNFSEAEQGNVLLYVGRVVCPVLTATGLFVVLRNGLKLIIDAFVSKMKNATAVYYDTEQMKAFGKGFCHPVFMGSEINKRVKSHVLLFEKDVDNLTFYKKMEGKIKKNSKVYIRLDQIESKLLKKSDVYYFNINEIIARTYWKERNLKQYLKNGRLEAKIAILGFDALGQNLLDYGLMNNVYSLNQSIQYHVWGESRRYRNLLGDFDKMNEDTITYHDNSWQEELELLKSFDRIIVTLEADVQILQTLLYLNSDAEIDFYNPMGADLVQLYEGDKLTSFGELETVLTEENIKTDKLYRMAKEINYEYIVDYRPDKNCTWECPDMEEKMEREWKELPGFFKGSNVARADYQDIRRLVLEALELDKDHLTAEQEEIFAEMEHIRWSRYYFVNHWSYCEKRNDKKRLHHLLIPYDKLPRAEQKKDNSKKATV